MVSIFKSFSKLGWAQNDGAAGVKENGATE